ncbi:5'-nucleotidase C-terminal domain-containing protein [Maribacter litopenaei]|uniref:5'-nucleotidase C-terminal domain-containing protein n=1 Tax=Maribacter litopenaei TaxID=2976127 RepID=A0ABY5YE31_9FLAO|nr:5'-nucleotidase [Maribacter litopenaei]UWX56375.1 5'-nucleotidase C-terminal domain-containing protein [Maribacter litopenaei]
MTKLKHFGYLKIKHFVIFLTTLLFVSCRQNLKTLSKIEGKQVEIDSTYGVTDSIAEFILPYHKRVEEVLDSTLAYASWDITKTDGTYNTSAGNLMADIILEQAAPIFKSRTGTDLDFVLLNHGGIRSSISEGKVSARTAFEVMPFENNISIVELKGTSVKEMLSYLIQSKRAHPVAGIQLVLNTDDSIKSLTIKGEPFDENKNYYVATSDYLVSGGDDMVFFKDALEVTDIDYKIRSAMIDFFTKVDTLSPKVDLRYYKVQ